MVGNVTSLRLVTSSLDGRLEIVAKQGTCSQFFASVQGFQNIKSCSLKRITPTDTMWKE